MKGSGDSIVARYAMAILITAALMVWISVNEDGPADLAGQTLFWSVSVTAGWLQMILIARGVRATLGPSRYAGWVMMLATALVGAVPLTFEVRWLLEVILAPERGLPPPWLTYLNVAVINAVFCLVQYVLIERWPLTAAARATAPNPQVATAGPPALAMLSRRPDGLGGTIRYLRTEDHYLRVVTDQGEGLTLHRMSDARGELDGSDGMQVHRSWWVSRAAIDRVIQTNRRRFLVIHDGTEIPVGRSFEKSLRSAGWI